jgi:Uma2 family endonuclease
MSVAAVMGTEPLFVPDEVRDLASFRAWVHTADLPEKLRVHFLNGQVWVEQEMEEIRTHTRVKTALGFALAALVENSGVGFYLGDGVRYTNEDGDFSTEPDAVVILTETWETGGVWTDAGPQADATELVGTPDLVVEIVSRHSVQKDTNWHFANYHAAGVPEYWLIDARGADVAFDIWKRGARKYTAVKKVGGWVKSPVLGRSFRLSRTETVPGMPTFTLEIQ